MIQDLRATGITLSLARSGAAQSARTGGDKSSIPRDFFSISDSRREETIEAIAEKTVLAIPADGLNVSRSVIRSSRVNCAIGSVSVPHAIPGTTPDPWWRHRA